MRLHQTILILLLGSLAAYCQATNPPPAGETAGIYAAREVAQLKALLPGLAPGAKLSERHDGQVTNFICEWPDVTVRLTLRPHWSDSGQRLAMKNWIAALPAADTNAPAARALLHKVDSTVDCIGSAITPGYDPEGKASSLVLGLAAKLDGYVFSHKAFYDAAGGKVVGDLHAPLNLQDQR